MTIQRELQRLARQQQRQQPRVFQRVDLRYGPSVSIVSGGVEVVLPLIGSGVGARTGRFI